MNSALGPQWRRFVRHGTGVAAIVALGGWLFGDTYAKYAGFERGAAIRFAHFGSVEDYELWHGILGEFQKANPEIEVRQEYVVGTVGQYESKLRQQQLSDSTPDVVVLQQTSFAEFAPSVESLDDLLHSRGLPAATRFDSTDGDSEYEATALATFRWQGSQRGWPLYGGPLVVYSNLDAISRAEAARGERIEVPSAEWDVEEFLALATTLTLDADERGFTPQFGFWLPRWVYTLPFVWAFGADVTDATGSHWRFVGPEAEAAMGFLRRLVQSRVCPREDEVPQVAQDVAFLTGRVAMCVNGPWFQPFLDRTRLASRYRVLPMPRGPAGRATRITWDGVVLRSGLPAARRARAMRLLRFLVSSDAQDRIARTGRALPSLRRSMNVFTDGDGPCDRRPFVEALSYSRWNPMFPGFATVDRVINARVYPWLYSSDTGSSAEFLDQLANNDVIRNAFPAGASGSPGM